MELIDPIEAVRARRRPLRRSEYDRLISIGAFDNERLELLFGMLVRMSPQGAAHFEAITRLYRVLLLAVGNRADVRSQGPLALSDDSEPEPDVMILPVGDYSKELPSRALLVVEVSASTLMDDRQLKGPLYAAAGVPEYWIVNLGERVVEVYAGPTASGYRERNDFGSNETISPAAFPDARVHIDDILPRA